MIQEWKKQGGKGPGESPHGEGHGNLLQYSCLENPLDRGAWQATVHGVAKSWTRLTQLSIHTHTHGNRTQIEALERKWFSGWLDP